VQFHPESILTEGVKLCCLTFLTLFGKKRLLEKVNVQEHLTRRGSLSAGGWPILIIKEIDFKDTLSFFESFRSRPFPFL